MAYTMREFDSIRELVDYLNDIVLGKSLYVSQKVQGLDGLTLIINDGVADRTVTFSDATGEGLLLKDIIDQIKATHANLNTGVSLRSYAHNVPPVAQIAVVTDTYIVRGTGTANAILGFAATDTTVGANAVLKANIVAVPHMENQRIAVIHE